MQIIKDQNIVNPSTSNGIVVDDANIAVINCKVNGAPKNNFRITGDAENCWLIDCESENAGIDGFTVHRGGSGSKGEGINHINLLNCTGRGAGEEDGDNTVGEDVYWLACNFENMNIGHGVKRVFLIACEITGELKVKASTEVYLIRTEVEKLTFEKQGSGPGAGLGPESVIAYNSEINIKNFNQYANAFQVVTTLPAAVTLPVPPAELAQYIPDWYNEEVMFGIPPVTVPVDPTPDTTPDPTPDPVNTTVTVEREELLQWMQEIDIANVQLSDIKDNLRTLANKIQGKI